MPGPSHCPTCGTARDPELGCPACLLAGLLADNPEKAIPMGTLPVIEGYEVIEEIGHGGMGVVYRARQESSGREVALKMIAPQTLRGLEARQRFLMEVETMAAVQHPALMPLYDAGEDALGRPWLSMAFANGGTLSARLGQYAQQWQASATLLVTLSRAIAFAHERGVLHRDLKPANILFDAAGHPFVADFGLAKWADEDGGVTRSASVLGSPAYLAPEAAASGSKATTTVSDVYGLGAILYELLCGVRPYDGKSAPEILTRIREHPPVPPRVQLPGIPRDLEVIVMKAMAREPSQRYASASALADDLQRWLDGRPIHARPLGLFGKCASWARRQPALATLSALLMVSLLTGGVLLSLANRRLNASLQDVEARVDFMTRELPTRLAPLGRLDLLDSVFANVAAHYENSPATGTRGLAREADFLTNWAQILRPRGQTLPAVDLLRQAMEKARAATASARAPRDAIHARINTGRRYAEALIEARRFAEAQSVLVDSTHFAEAHPTDDLTYLLLRADLEMERYFLESKQNRTTEGLPYAQAALQRLRAVQSEMEQPPHTDEKNKVLRSLVKSWLIVIQAHAFHDDTAKLDAEFDGLHLLLDRMRLLLPDDPEVRYFSANRWLTLARYRANDPQATLDHLIKAEQDTTWLLTRDASNVLWRMEAIHADSRLETHSWKAGDEPARMAARARMADRIGYLYSAGITDVHLLLQLREWAVQCGDKHQSDDWPTARHHYTEGIKIQQRLARLHGDPEETAILGRATQRIADKITEREGKEAAEKWQRELEAETDRIN